MEIELADGTVLEAPDGADPSAIAKNYLAKQNQSAAPAEKPSIGKQLLSDFMRPIAKGAASLPLMAMDAGVASRNLIGNAANKVMGNPATPNYQMPSDMFNQSLDSMTLPPQTTTGKVAETLSSMVVGGAIPGPTGIANQAPANFRPPPAPGKETVFAASRDAGYVAPPATIKPTLGNRMGETLGGKRAVEQDASVANQGVTTGLAKKALGIAEDQPLSREALATVRSNAGAAYDQIRSAGTITTSKAFQGDLAQVTAKYRGAEKSFPGLAKTDIADVVAKVDKPQFEADSAIDAIGLLRDKASTAYAQGDKMMGKAYRDISGAIEKEIERNLASRGKDGAAQLQSFRQARQLIAKTYSVESALNDATGDVSAVKLGQQLSRGKPLSGDLKTAAQFGQTFPKAAREVLDSGSVRNTDLIVGGGTAAMSGHPWYLGYPLARMAARNALLSDSYQNSLLQSQGGNGVNPRVLNALLPLATTR